MKRAVLIASLAALAACGGEPAEQPQPVDAETSEPGAAATQEFDAIPESFRGHWEFALQDCDAAASEGRLEVSGDALDYYESRGEVVSVDGNPQAVTVTAGFAGEGESWQEELGLELGEDGERLTVTTPDGNLSIRMRCP